MAYKELFEKLTPEQMEQPIVVFDAFVDEAEAILVGGIEISKEDVYWDHKTCSVKCKTPYTTEEYKGYTLSLEYGLKSQRRGIFIKKDGETINQCHIHSFNLAKKLINTFLEVNDPMPYPLPIKTEKRPAVGFNHKFHH